MNADDEFEQFAQQYRADNGIKSMTAKRTTWNGCTFRSRAEARWAVFFEMCDVEWEYEPEGVVFDDNTSYLPDFLIHGIVGRGGGDLYVEVKGVMDDVDRQKIDQFSRYHPIYVVDSTFTTKNDKPWYDHMEEMQTVGLGDYYTFKFIDGDQWGAYLGINNNGQLQLFDRWTYYDSAGELTAMAYRVAAFAKFEYGDSPESNPNFAMIRQFIRKKKAELAMLNFEFRTA